MSITKLRPLVSSNWLSERLAALTSHRHLRVLDASFDNDPQFDSYGQHYKPKHIPGSKHFDGHRCVKHTIQIPRNLPEIGCFTDYVRRLGVGADTHIVTYDRLDNKMACRTWWLLRLHGHENVSVLDGGLGKWVADGFPTTSEDPDYEVGDFEPVMNYKILRDYEAMVKNVETKAEAVVDSRPKDMFNGIDADNVGGHIRGAKNLPFDQLFNKDGTFRSKEELQQMFDDIDVDLSEPMVASCRLGLTACGLALAAAVAGKPDVPVYYGSWTEWSRRAPRNLIA